MIEHREIASMGQSHKKSSQWTAVSQLINSFENHKNHQVILPNEKAKVGHATDPAKDIFTTITDKIEEITKSPADALKVTAIGAGALALAYIIHKPGILTRLAPRAFFRSGAAEAEAIEQLAARKLPTTINLEAPILARREVRLGQKEMDKLYNSFNSERAKLGSSPAGSATSAERSGLTPEQLKTREWEKFVFKPANPEKYVPPVHRPLNTGGFDEIEDWEFGLPLD
jgi:hypothetical protein